MENLSWEEPRCSRTKTRNESKPNASFMRISHLSLWSLSVTLILVLLVKVPLIRSQSYKVRAYPSPAAQNWVSLSTKKSKFTNRNGHATCTFKGKIWLIGGRTQVYNKYNLLPSTLVADLWYSTDGANWFQESNLAGDFFAQNNDVQAPGGVGPFYERYGHTLDAIDSKTINAPISQNSQLYRHRSSQNDYMIMTGGFSPDPSNDVWISAEGRIWSFVDQPPPWSARAWHKTTVYQGKLWLMGGTPLTNDVWYLNSLKVDNRSVGINNTHADPLTRSMYMPYTYLLEWILVGNAPWEPRVGFGLVTQWWFNETIQTHDNATERMMLVGGYGGWIDPTLDAYTGVHCWQDSWDYHGAVNVSDPTQWIGNWTLLSKNTGIGERAWFPMKTLQSADARLNFIHTVNQTSPRIFLFGGGNIQNTTQSSQKLIVVKGYSDAWWTRDGVTWTQINFQFGGVSNYTYGYNLQALYTSQEWSKTVVNSATVYLGLWGHTLENFNCTAANPCGGVTCDGLSLAQKSPCSFSGETADVQPGGLYLIGGDYDGAGPISNSIFQAQPGIWCDYNGVLCNYIQMGLSLQSTPMTPTLLDPTGTLPPICGQASFVNPTGSGSPYVDFTNITKGCQCSNGYKGDVCEIAPPAVAVAAAWRLSSMDMWITFTISSLVVNLLTTEYGLNYFLFNS